MPPKPHNKRRGITYSGQRTTHQTDGLAGYPAVDIFAKPGTPFLAPEKGRIVRISGHPGTTKGNVYGSSVYFVGVSGRTYFITHLGTTMPIGSYNAGQALGTVSRWDTNPGSSHAHVGIHDGGYTGPNGNTTAATPPATTPASAPTSQTATTTSTAYPVYTPVSPPSTEPPMPQLPGSASAGGEQDLAQAWRLVAGQTLASPEAQRWAALMGRAA